MSRYNPKEIEPKWQQYWLDNQTYKADLKSAKPKYIAMSMFNYPSGAGIHIGHAMNYTISDVLARFKRQQGYESYHPVGWDSFGLPAENYAIKAGVSPQDSMATIIPNYHKQYQAMGWSNDWSKEIAAHEPIYYKWTQWIFSEMYRAGLAYQDSRMQWWCDKCQTVLANEQVINDKCWRHDSADDPEVSQREVKQWFFKISDYSDELLEAIDDLDWTESVKLAQKNWIGKSVGAEVEFIVGGQEDVKIKVFTTRADTLFAATFLVLAPEHDLVAKITTPEQKDVIDGYVKDSLKKSAIERQANKEKSGVFTGAYAINPVNNEKIPIWIADFVLADYGTGAVFADAHDDRDVEFAQKYDIPLKTVINPVSIRSDAADLKEFKQKKKVVAVVENQKGEVLTINWGDEFGGRLTIGGTIENDEDIETTAIREVTEETGYTDLEVVEVGAETYFYKYFAFSKQEGHDVEAKFIHLKLKSDKRQEPKLDDSEKGKFKVEWVSRNQAAQEITEPLHAYGISKFIKKEAYTGEGRLYNSGKYDGLSTSEAREKIVADLAAKGLATEKVNFRMRDWSVSRQRYWGAPVPIIYCPDHGPVLVSDEDLPVILPEIKDYAPSGDGRSALARAGDDWLKAKCPKCDKIGERETDTLDTYIDSSWYMLRYFDPANETKIFESDIINKWMPIDFYNGADHATAHMIYARFITRFFHKQGLIDNPEPFKKFLFNGKVTAHDGQMFSKSKGNGIDPLEIIEQGYGADALRTYLMFAAPLDLWARWDPQGVPGTFRFLSRVWGIVQEFLAAKPDDSQSAGENRELLGVIHRTIMKVSKDIEGQRYNTAIAALMQCTNDLYKLKTKGFDDRDDWRFALESLVQVVAPFAPHVAEELWHQLGHEDSVSVDHWPVHDPKLVTSDEVTIVVQVNGKVRANLRVAKGSDEISVTNQAKAEANVAKFIGEGEPKKVIFVTDKLINFVV